MSQTVEITIAAAGTDTGPFNIFSNLDYVTPFATGVLKADLLAGYISTVVPDAATSVRVKSNSVGCTNYVDMEITGATTVRLDWRVGNQPGGALVVFNNVESQLLNITSTAGRVQSGTIYPLISELPYTIRGEWVSGSGNIIQFNLCDITGGGLIYASGPITNVEEYEDYLVTPTPIYGLVNLTAQNVTPPSCPV